MLSKATLIGRVGKKQRQQLQGGSSRVYMSIATTKRYTDKNTGQKKESTSWHGVSFYGGLADVADKYAEVGNLIYIEGELSSQSQVGPDGKKFNSCSITAKELKLLPNAKKQGGNGNSSSQPSGNMDYDQPPF